MSKWPLLLHLDTPVLVQTPVPDTCAALCSVCTLPLLLCRELHYYTRGIDDGSSSSSKQQPIVFIHGVAGLLLYLPLLGRLLSCKAPLLLLDMKHVSLRISPSIPTVDELATSLAAALKLHKLPPALVVAHSYGTLVAGRLLRLQRSAVARVLFVDPVCFGMFMPRLLHGFIYAPLRLHADRWAGLAVLQPVHRALAFWKDNSPTWCLNIALAVACCRGLKCRYSTVLLRCCALSEQWPWRERAGRNTCVLGADILASLVHPPLCGSIFQMRSPSSPV